MYVRTFYYTKCLKQNLLQLKKTDYTNKSENIEEMRIVITW
jgi:hypothetical protein